MQIPIAVLPNLIALMECSICCCRLSGEFVFAPLSYSERVGILEDKLRELIEKSADIFNFLVLLDSPQSRRVSRVSPSRNGIEETFPLTFHAEFEIFLTIASDSANFN